MNQKAFTLIELSIVLVIIGLIVGGVLVGKDLLHASRIRQTVSQKEQFDTAAATFKLKYNCWPGDCSNASQFGFTSGSTTTTSPNGNGNGVVCNVITSNQYSMECINFWHHLWEARLLKDDFEGLSNPTSCMVPGFHSPKTPITKAGTAPNACGITLPTPSNGGWTLVNLDAVSGITVGRTGIEWPSIPYLGRTYIISGGDADWGAKHAPVDYRSLDQKIDDGLPLSGNVYAVNVEMRNNALTGATLSLPASDCVNASQYVNSATPIGCTLIMKAGF